MIQMEQLRRLSELRQNKVERFQRDLIRARAYVDEAQERLVHLRATHDRLAAKDMLDVDITDDSLLADPASRFMALAQTIERHHKAQEEARIAVKKAETELAEVARNVEWILRILADAEARKKAVDKLFARGSRKAATLAEAREEELATEQFLARSGTPGTDEIERADT